MGKRRKLSSRLFEKTKLAHNERFIDNEGIDVVCGIPAEVKIVPIDERIPPAVEADYTAGESANSIA